MTIDNKTPSKQVSLPSVPWYHEVSRYQWLVLLLASAGWVFDVYEGQVFNITRHQLLADVLGAAMTEDQERFYGDVLLAVFLTGGTLGGLLFGSLADRWGRRPMLVVTILVYSLFSGLTYFATTLWEVTTLRFLVALGVGGEWAVAAALVAEVFPPRARAQASGIFHATSILGTWLAALAGLWAGAEWRYAYLVGVLPALLILLIRAKVRESEAWSQVEASAPGQITSPGSFRELLGDSRWRQRAVLGVLLGAVGLGTFWGVTVAGQDLARATLLRQGVSREETTERAKFAYGIVQTAGGGLGLLAFGPLAARLGRRWAFTLVQIGALIVVPLTCFLPVSYNLLLGVLPIYGFFTLSMHAGFAVYFPELFPTRLRATGASFCFNGGRLLAAPVLVLSGWLKGLPGMDLRLAITLLGLLFAAGVIIVWRLPETRGQALPE